MRIAVYGGSFDPPHVGHLMVAAWLRWTDQVDEVWLVVSHDHPFGKSSAPYATRLDWGRRAVADLPGVEVSDIESHLPRPSYTIATLEALTQAHAGYTFRFVLGSDTFASVDRWHRWDEIAARFAPIVVARSGHPAPSNVEVPRASGPTGRAVGPVFPEVSSTDVRERVRKGLPVDGLVPRGVLELVVQHYSSPGAAAP